MSQYGLAHMHAIWASPDISHFTNLLFLVQICKFPADFNVVVYCNIYTEGTYTKIVPFFMYRKYCPYPHQIQYGSHVGPIFSFPVGSASQDDSKEHVDCFLSHKPNSAQPFNFVQFSMHFRHIYSKEGKI